MNIFHMDSWILDQGMEEEEEQNISVFQIPPKIQFLLEFNDQGLVGKV